MKARKRAGTVGKVLGCALLLVIALFPIYWLVAMAIRPTSEMQGHISLIPQSLTIEHFISLFVSKGFGQAAINSLQTTLSSLVLSLIVGVCAAYILARRRFRFGLKRPMTYWVLLVRVLPPVAFTIPLYTMFSKIGLLNTKIPVTLACVLINVPLIIWFLISFFQDLPEEVEESAKVDGATEWQLFRKIVLPLVAPGIAAVAMLSFMYAWNEYTYTVIFTRSPSNYTVPLALSVLNTEDNLTNFGLAACGGGGEDTADEGSEGSTSGEPTKMTLILRGGAYGESLEASLAPFEAEHNVDIEVMLMSFDDLHTGIALDAVNEVGTYDLCMVDGSWMAEFTENGVLANLSEMGYSFDDDIIPATTTICKVGEDIYLAPYYGNVTVMMYNKQLLADAGYAPEDIDSFADLMDIAQKTKAADSNKNGFLIRGGSADNILSDFLPHLVVHGGWVVDENNNPTVDTPEFKAAMQEYLDLYALGSTLDKDDIVASVTSGETALAQIWPGWYTPTADGPANYTTIPTKLTDDSAPVDAVALQGVWCIGIPDNAPHKDLALELLEYVMSPEVQLASIENNGVPCRYSCLTDSTVLETYPHLQTVCGALETGVYRPVIEEWTEFTNILGTEMDNVIQGTKTLDEALSYAQEQLEQLMAG